MLQSLSTKVITGTLWFHTEPCQSFVLSLKTLLELEQHGEANDLIVFLDPNQMNREKPC